MSRPDLKDHIKSVKTQNRLKNLVSGIQNSGGGSATAAGAQSIETAQKRARSINKIKLNDPDSSLSFEMKKPGQHDKSFTE